MFNRNFNSMNKIDKEFIVLALVIVGLIAIYQYAQRYNDRKIFEYKIKELEIVNKAYKDLIL